MSTSPVARVEPCRAELGLSVGGRAAGEREGVSRVALNGQLEGRSVGDGLGAPGGCRAAGPRTGPGASSRSRGSTAETRLFSSFYCCQFHPAVHV